MGGAWNILWKNYWAMKNLGLWSPVYEILFKKFVKPSGPLPTYLMYAPLFIQLCWVRIINSFQANVLFQYPLNTSEILWFSDAFREYRKETFSWNRLWVSSTRFYLIIYWAVNQCYFLILFQLSDLATAY